MKKEREKSNKISSPPDMPTLRFGHIAQHLINAMPLGVVVFDRKLNITDINPRARVMLASRENIAQALTEGTDRSSYVSPDEATWQQRLQQALDNSETQTFENISYTNNSAPHVLRIIFTPLSDESQTQNLGGILLIEDVTEKVMMENDLALAERMAAVGRLAARIAHELNNPLDGIIRYLNLALRISDQNENAQSSNYLRQSRKGLQRMVQIISELLEFSRSTHSVFEEADVNKIVEESVKTMLGQAQENEVRIIRHYGRNLPNIRSGNLFQVFCNLIKNAVDAMENGGSLTITTSSDEHNLLIEFADTGCGFDEEIQAKLFEPFFTTKQNGKGTGLGLAICKDIMERYNGQIIAENCPQGGACFKVRIPLERTARLPA